MIQINYSPPNCTAKSQRRKTRQYLEKIAAQAKDNWVKIAQQELTQQRYPDLREAQLDQFLTPQEYQLTQQGNLTATEWGDIFIRLNMAACKRGNLTQQQAFFTDISGRIDSGFAEVCQRLGVMETQITQLLQGLESTLESLVAEIRSHFDAANPHLSLAEWRPIAELMLAERQALTANPAFKRVDVYVPLALVERRQVKERKPGLSRENPEQEREEESMTPIAEDEFFDRVLRQGKSPKSQGRRIAVIGEPGSGKTTRLQAIADWILAEHLGIPIWIELAQFTELTLVDYLEKWLKSAGVEGAMSSLQDHKEYLWLLMDGEYERVARIEQPQVSQLLTGWVGLGRAIITCRVNVWEADQNAFSGFDVYRNLPFEAEQMETFIRRFFAQSD